MDNKKDIDIAKVKYDKISPLIWKTLENTYGTILYQEQITEVCVKLFGMTEIEADQVRYYVGKKLKDEMKKTEPILYEKGRERNSKTTGA